MPKFTTISPTCEKGGKERAWERFRDGKYVAIGWLYEENLTGMQINEILSAIRAGDYEPEDMKDGLASFPSVWSLKPGDYVGIKNVNWGLFGIGKIDSEYQYDRYKHLAEPSNHYYPHFFEVKWVIDDYISAKQMDIKPEVAWKPRGTVGQVYPKLPEYIKRVLKKVG